MKKIPTVTVLLINKLSPCSNHVLSKYAIWSNTNSVWMYKNESEHKDEHWSWADLLLSVWDASVWGGYSQRNGGEWFPVIIFKVGYCRGGFCNVV